MPPDHWRTLIKFLPLAVKCIFVQARAALTGLLHKKKLENTGFLHSRAYIEVTTRFELVIRELQSLALPLGYVTIFS